MTPLQAMIAKHEGFRSNIYKCTAGCLTIGYGTNLSAGISERKALVLMQFDIESVTTELLHKLPFFNSLSAARQAVLIDMGYNLGVPRLMEFGKMIRGLEVGDWNIAAHEMLESKWAKQVGIRSTELAQIMRSGVM